MTGVSRSLFAPLSLAVGFSMIGSFLLSSSLVPVLSVWLLGNRRGTAGTHSHGEDWVDRLRNRLGRFLQLVAPAKWILVTAYAAVNLWPVVVVGCALGSASFPVRCV